MVSVISERERRVLGTEGGNLLSIILRFMLTIFIKPNCDNDTVH